MGHPCLCHSLIMCKRLRLERSKSKAWYRRVFFTNCLNVPMG